MSVSCTLPHTPVGLLSKKKNTGARIVCLVFVCWFLADKAASLAGFEQKGQC